MIVTHGLGAPTATIAQQAGVANGSLFTYFPSKADLFNHLYLELKADMAAAVLDGLPTTVGLREQQFRMWSNWMRWAVSHPDKRSAVAQLGVSDEITPQTRASGHQTMAGIGVLLEQCRANGPMREAPMGFVVAMVTALAESTVDYMVKDPANADKHCTTGFEAMWRTIA